jgi:hypothetical protein
MIKFIKLTEVFGDRETLKSIIINSSHIQHIRVGNKGKDIHIRMSDKTFFFVKETLEEIESMLND